MRRTGLVAIAVVVALVIAGCAGTNEDAALDDGAASVTGVDETVDADTTQAGADASDGGSTAAAGGTQVLMMGRSVMAGWFQYWGWDWDGPVERNGFTLTYSELDSPPSIAFSACEHTRSAPEGSVVFFKFCFVDFYGADGSEGDRQLDDMKAWVAEVVDCASQRGVTLIIGNALPQVEDYTDAALVSQHRVYNAWLDEYIAGRGDSVRVLDLYAPLATSSGGLRPEFAVGSHDSHLNSDAYAVLDPLLFGLLEEVSR